MKNYIASLTRRAFSDSPLKNKTFRLFYLGSIGTGLGFTMQTTIASWVMATLTPSEFMVALVQSASTAPSMLFGLVAGSLADITDRRRLVLLMQYAMMIATALLGVLMLTGHAGPATLLMLTFVVGTGLALYVPAQQSSINDLVSREHLSQAVALTSVAFNVSRAIGPAMAGGIAAWFGSGNALLGSSLFFVLMIVSVSRTSWPGPAKTTVREALLGGVLTGLRYARHSSALKPLIIRCMCFGVCAASFWALLPVIAKTQLHLDAGGFGLLSAAFGTGAIIGALAMPGQLRRRSLNSVVTGGSVLWLAAMALLAWTETTSVAIVAAAAAGSAWVTVFAALSAGVQSSAPGWVRARAVSMYLVASQAGLALGSALWGAIASATTLRTALFASLATLAVLLVVNYRTTVAMGSEADITPGDPPPDMSIASHPQPTDGPVLIQIEYRVADLANQVDFMRAIRSAEPIRRRNGASSWRVFRDLGDSELFVERYLVESWAEYVRLRSRGTVADYALQERIERLQKAGVAVRVSRLIGIDGGRSITGEEPVDRETPV